MGSVYGTNLKISLFGESHNTAIGMVIDGLPAGLVIDNDFIDKELAKRKPQGSISTPRKEKDEVKFLSGVFNGFTTGAPLAFMIENENTHSSDYVKGEARPSHADYTAFIKYNGFNDYRGGGHFSGRITAPIVVLGAICKMLLKKKGITVGSHISNIGEVYDECFDEGKLPEQLEKLNSEYFAVISSEKEEEMKEVINKAKQESDSVGGSIQTVVINMPAGIGEPYFNSVESVISSLLFSVGGVKGVSFGIGEKFAHSRGSEVNDQMRVNNGKADYLSNNNGGINGGITNGMPIIINTIIKPTPSIGKEQKSINMETMENTDLQIKGRHDPCIVHRARSVVDALVAYALVDLIMSDNARKF